MSKETQAARFERRSRTIVLITAVTMAVEIWAGYLTRSMALLADGWHMGSHVFALGLTWLAYVVARRLERSRRYDFNRDNLLALAGFTSAMVLLGFAFLVGWESVGRLLSPYPVRYREAILVAVIGLAVNIICAWFLHHDHHHHDHNIRAAYLHVMADALTSVSAILALTFGWYFGLPELDAVGGIICTLVIFKWSFNLIRDTGRSLIGLKGSTR